MLPFYINLSGSLVEPDILVGNGWNTGLIQRLKKENKFMIRPPNQRLRVFALILDQYLKSGVKHGVLENLFGLGANI